MAKASVATEACDIRWLIGPDRPQVLAIDADSFHVPMTEEELSVIGTRVDFTRLVAVRRGRRHEILGYLIYSIKADRYEVCRMAVRPDARRSEAPRDRGSTDGLGARVRLRRRTSGALSRVRSLWRRDDDFGGGRRTGPIRDRDRVGR